MMQEKKAVEVTRDDQERINTFGRLNNDYNFVKAEIQIKKVSVIAACNAICAKMLANELEHPCRNASSTLMKPRTS
jgi:hypothetical protein